MGSWYSRLRSPLPIDPASLEPMGPRDDTDEDAKQEFEIKEAEQAVTYADATLSRLDALAADLASFPSHDAERRPEDNSSAAAPAEVSSPPAEAEASFSPAEPERSPQAAEPEASPLVELAEARSSSPRAESESSSPLAARAESEAATADEPADLQPDAEPAQAETVAVSEDESAGDSAASVEQDQAPAAPTPKRGRGRRKAQPEDTAVVPDAEAAAETSAPAELPAEAESEVEAPAEAPASVPDMPAAEPEMAAAEQSAALRSDEPDDTEPVSAPSSKPVFDPLPEVEDRYAPAGVSTEDAVHMLGDADRRLASEIDFELSHWERAHRGGAGFTPAQARDELMRLIGERRSLLTAPDEVLLLYINNLREGLFGLEQLLARPTLSDIMINDWDRIFIEDGGELRELEKSPLRNEADLDTLVSRIVQRTGGSLDLANPTLEEQFPFQTPTGEINVRVNINLGSLTITRRPTISLRRPTASGYDRLDTWAKIAAGETDSPLTPQAVDFMRLCARYRASMLVVGSTGSGKTSMMKALLVEIDPDDRVIVIEQANELDLRTMIDDYVGLRANDQPNQSIPALIKSAMRMRPDRVIVGELRDGMEVDGLLRAINTGHAGSISTIHASSARDGLQAVLTLAAQNSANSSSVEHIGRLIHPGLDLVVFLGVTKSTGPDGKKRRIRRVMEIATVVEFRVRDGVPDFVLANVFDRGESGAVSSRKTLAGPLLCRGFASLSDTFVSRMHAQGLTEEMLRKALET